MSVREQEYYVGDKVFYQPAPPPPDYGPGVSVTYEKPRIGPCTWILLAILILFIIVLIIVLILFFTLKGSTSTSAYYYSYQTAGGSTIPGHKNLLSASEVSNLLIGTSYKICLLDAAYSANKDYKAFFNRGHIDKRAQLVDLEKIAKRTVDKRRELIHPLEFQSYARALGVSGDCHVVVYDNSDDANSMTHATFVWWAFKVYGHERVSVLDGGLRAWKKAGYQTTTETTLPAVGSFEASWTPAYIITYDDVVKNFETKKYRLVDSRKEEEFKGQAQSKDAKEPGRIVGAVNVPVTSLVTLDGSLQDAPALSKTLSDKGVKVDQEWIVYSNTGLESSSLYLVLLQSGINAKMYDGGWVEWSRRASNDRKEKS